MFVGLGGPQGSDWTRPTRREELEPGWTAEDLVKGVTHLLGLVTKVEEQVERAEALPCKAGCSWCCENVTVLLSEAEWRVILRYLQIADRKLVRKLLRKCLIAHKKHKDVVEQITAEQERAEELAAQIRRPCPFLEDGLCSIYEARPHDCRLYGCSFKGEELYACHLVEDAVAGREVSMPRYEQSAAMLRLYPRTELRQTFAYWAKHHLPDELRELALGPEPE